MDNPIVLAMIVAAGASFLTMVYFIVRFAIGDGLRDFENWKKRR